MTLESEAFLTMDEAGACFDELGREPDRQAMSPGQGTVRLIQAKPLYVRLNFRDGQGFITAILNGFDFLLDPMYYAIPDQASLELNAS